jgi:hypothetical protein
MPVAARSARARRSRAALLLALAALAISTGCSTWKPVPRTDPAAQAAPQRILGEVRLTLRSGETVTVEDPLVAADSVRAYRVEKTAGATLSAPQGETRTPYAVATSDVTKLERSEFSKEKTGIIVLSVIGVYVLLALSGVIGDD